INRIKNNKKFISNFTYLSILEIFILLAPFITYPYLVRILGRELYGWVITAQVTASYCTILIDFGFKRISARHIATNTGNLEKIGEIISAILTLRGILWLLSFILYVSIVWLIVPYRHQMVLFLYSFLTTLSSVFFLDFYFQGTENMKYITIVNIVVRGIFVAATFVFITGPEDYIYVPLLWGIGYAMGGAISLGIVFIRHKIRFKIPDRGVLQKHMHEGSVVFFSDLMLTIKDKFNYNLMGGLIGMSDIVIYDIGSKISSLLLKPITILSTVLYPTMAKTPSVSLAKKTMGLIIFISSCLVIVVNIFLPWIVRFFIDEDVDLLAIRLFTLSPIILGVSSFVAINIFFAFGKEKLVLRSTIVTTIGYLCLLVIMYFLDLLTSVMAFVILTISAYSIEAIYRGLLFKHISKEENQTSQPH
ncbi:MAG: oligosaccharide flippase family protein, partial [Ruminococcus sp.]|nr:oligosaccharide flippase family protein [Ruminococcus sp.]